MKDERNSVLPIVLTGEVVHGKALGRTVGMPTANLCVAPEELPEAGVYATKVEVGGKIYNSITNIGKRPSVDKSDKITVETYIFDFEEEIYGQIIKLEIFKFLRPVRKFDDLEEVRKQVEKDILEVKVYFNQNNKC